MVHLRTVVCAVTQTAAVPVEIRRTPAESRNSWDTAESGFTRVTFVVEVVCGRSVHIVGTHVGCAYKARALQIVLFDQALLRKTRHIVRIAVGLVECVAEVAGNLPGLAGA